MLREHVDLACAPHARGRRLELSQQAMELRELHAQLRLLRVPEGSATPAAANQYIKQVWAVGPAVGPPCAAVVRKDPEKGPFALRFAVE